MKYLATALLLLTTAGAANAGHVDFTVASVWGAADGKTVHQVGNVQLSTNFGTLNQGDFGIGIDSFGSIIGLGVEDEINWLLFGSEKLTLTFIEPTVVRSIELLNLFFYEHGGPETFKVIAEDEFGVTDVLTGPITAPTNADGLWILDLPANLGRISTLKFTVPFDCWTSDYSFGGIVTPLPATVWLFGSALFGLLGWRHRVVVS